MKVLVGLGNPGVKYSISRHNIGFITLDLIAAKYSLVFEKSKRFEAEIATGIIEEQSCILCKPLTYMNLSGRSVAKLLNYYKLAADDLLVLFDDIDLERGKVKVKQDGGHGGHNGVRSILASLGKSNFQRIKLGVGRPVQIDSEQNIDIAAWVLQSMSERDVELLENKMFETVLERIRTFLR